MRVRELMSIPATTCSEESSLDTAAKLMHARSCGTLPVVDPTGAIVGMITDRDICMAAQRTGRCLADISVAESIDGRVFSVRPKDTVQRAEELMRENRVRRLPVVDGENQVVGVLSINDIAREGQRESGRNPKYQHIKSDEVMQTLAAICEPGSDEPRLH